MHSKITGVLLVLIIFFLGVLTTFVVIKGVNLPFLNNLTKNAPASISGTLDVNGVIADGSTVSIAARQIGSKEKASIVASGIPVVDGGAWSFNTASFNKSYEVQAQVVVNGQTVAISSPIEMTAPAENETLTLNLNAKATRSAIISGNIEVNGYIPQGATITIKGRKLGSATFTTVAHGLTGQPRQFMSYSTAIAGTTYEVEGVLLSSSGGVLGTSDILTVTAPALSETLIINSSAQTPVSPTPVPQNNQATQAPTPTTQATGSSYISGSINFNGAAPANSRIVIFEKPLNTSSYQVAVNNVTPTDGTTWQWNSAQGSSWYTVIAVLKQAQSNGTDQDIATSAPITIATPATNVILTLNSGMSLSAPGGPITVNCQNYNGGPNQNTWSVLVMFQSMSGAQSYWYQIGSTNGGNDLMNTTGNSNGAAQQQIGATFNNNTTYYARYAYANILNAAVGNPQYSGFSSTTPLQCSH